MNGWIRSALVGAALVGMSACSGGGGSGDSGGSSNPPPPPNQKVGGIWDYTYDSGGQTGVGLMLVAENGKFFSINVDDTRDCGWMANGTLTANGSAISSTGKFAFFDWTLVPGAAPGCSYPDGSSAATGTISGTVSQRSSISGTVTSRTLSGATLPSLSFAGTYDSTYDLDSSLATISGNWLGIDDLWVNISGNGTLFIQYPWSGCVVNGTVTVIDPAYNAYGVTATFASCTGAYAVLNGRTATGLGTIVPDSVPILLLGYEISLPNNEWVLLSSALEKR